jgi:Rrf2 family iron-sulfur cluster assembly transcriptional regulator
MDQISVAAIITAVDEKVYVTRCGGKTDCQDGERCLTHQLWSSLSGKIYNFLDDISLGKLVHEPGVQQVAERQDSRRQSKKEDVSHKVAFIHDERTPT